VLQAACIKGNEAIVKLLIEKGADPNVQGGYYGNILEEAWRGEREEIVRLLLEKGANVDAEGDDDIIRAQSVQDYELLARLLIARMESSGYIIEEELEIG
jgi:ankyrin repeat protein